MIQKFDVRVKSPIIALNQDRDVPLLNRPVPGWFVAINETKMAKVIHRFVGFSWSPGSACGAVVKLPSGEDVTVRTHDAKRVTCKRCLRKMKS